MQSHACCNWHNTGYKVLKPQFKLRNQHKQIKIKVVQELEDNARFPLFSFISYAYIYAYFVVQNPAQFANGFFTKTLPCELLFAMQKNPLLNTRVVCYSYTFMKVQLYCNLRLDIRTCSPFESDHGQQCRAVRLRVNGSRYSRVIACESANSANCNNCQHDNCMWLYALHVKYSNIYHNID